MTKPQPILILALFLGAIAIHILYIVVEAYRISKEEQFEKEEKLLQEIIAAKGRSEKRQSSCILLYTKTKPISGATDTGGKPTKA